MRGRLNFKKEYIYILHIAPHYVYCLQECCEPWHLLFFEEIAETMARLHWVYCIFPDICFCKKMAPC